MSQVFVTDGEFSCVGHMPEKLESGDTSTQKFQSVRVPRHMVMDGSKEMTHGIWGKQIKSHQAKQNIAKTHSQFHNKSETLIR